MQFVKPLYAAMLMGFLLLPPGLMARARAAEPNWPKEPYLYTVVNQDLRSVLERFGENIGVRVVISDSVKGTVQGTPPSSTPREFLDNLARAYGLDWYYDGNILAITSSSEQQTQTLPLHGMRFEDARQKLTDNGLLDHRYAFREGQPGMAVVAGPPQYVASVVHELGTGPEPPPPPPPAAATPAPNPDGQMVVHDGDHATVYRGPLYLPQSP